MQEGFTIIGKNLNKGKWLRIIEILIIYNK